MEHKVLLVRVLLRFSLEIEYLYLIVLVMTLPKNCFLNPQHNLSEDLLWISCFLFFFYFDLLTQRLLVLMFGLQFRLSHQAHLDVQPPPVRTQTHPLVGRGLNLAVINPQGLQTEGRTLWKERSKLAEDRIFKRACVCACLQLLKKHGCGLQNNPHSLPCE